MEQRQNLEFLGIQHGALIKVGLDIGAVHGKDFVKQLWMFLIECIVSLYVQYGLLHYAADVFKDRVDKATSSLSVFNQGTLLMLKIAVVIFKAKRLLKFIWDINLLATSANAKEHEVWVSENRRSVLVSKIYITACWAAMMCLTIIPIIIMGYQYLSSGEFERKLPFDGLYPFEHLGMPIFILNYLLYVKHSKTLLNLTSCIDPLFGWFVHAISGHFRILRLKVATAASRITEEHNNDEFLKDVASIVRYHVRLLSFIDELNNIYGAIFFAEVLLSCLQMCFLIYSLNNDIDMKSMPFNGVVFAGISIQMMIYCFGGEKVKNENEMLCEDIYMKFPWEKMRPNERKMLLLPLMRSQKDTPLVGLFFELDRNLLVFIYRTAFSFNTLLGTMKE